MPRSARISRCKDSRVDCSTAPDIPKIADICQSAALGVVAERFGRSAQQSQVPAKSFGRAHLPDGVLISLNGRDQEPLLIWDHELLTWSPGGDGERRRRLRGEVVTIFTPDSTVRAIGSGDVPEVYLGPWNTGRTTWDGSLAVR
jgi:hypothetical protein